MKASVAILSRKNPRRSFIVKKHCKYKFQGVYLRCVKQLAT